MAVKIYKAGEKHPDAGLSFAERDLKRRQERARLTAEHRVREKAFQAGEDPEAAVAAHRAALAPAPASEEKAESPSTEDENKQARRSPADENKAAKPKGKKG